jgi:hypothetical protein
MEEFSNAIGWKIFYCALAIGMILFSAVIATTDRSQSGDLILVIPAAVSLFALLILASQLKNKIIISAESIKRVTVFGNKEIATADINGCRISDKNIIIEPISPSGTKITLNSYTQLADSADLVSWLTTNFKDLDDIDLKQQEEQILHDPSLGFTEQEREGKLKWAKQIAMAYNGLGVALGILAIIFRDNHYLFIFSIIYPLIGIAIMRLSKGLIKFFSNRKRSAYPAIFLGMYFSALMTGVPMGARYNLLSYDHIWLPCVVVTLTLTALLYISGLNKAADGIAVQVFLMVMVSAFCAFGTTIGTNCDFDSSAPQKFHSTILQHWVHHGKSNSYYIKLRPWGPHTEAKAVSVSSSFFDEINDGDVVTIYLKKGYLMTIRHLV